MFKLIHTVTNANQVKMMKTKGQVETQFRIKLDNRKKDDIVYSMGTKLETIK